MRNKKIRIPLVAIGGFLFIFKGMFASYQMMVIPISNPAVGIGLLGLVLILILMGVFCFRDKSSSQEITELKDRINKLEKDKNKE